MIRLAWWFGLLSESEASMYELLLEIIELCAIYYDDERERIATITEIIGDRLCLLER